MFQGPTEADFRFTDRLTIPGFRRAPVCPPRPPGLLRKRTIRPNSSNKAAIASTS